MGLDFDQNIIGYRLGCKGLRVGFMCEMVILSGGYGFSVVFSVSLMRVWHLRVEAFDH